MKLQKTTVIVILQQKLYIELIPISETTVDKSNGRNDVCRRYLLTFQGLVKNKGIGSLFIADTLIFYCTEVVSVIDVVTYVSDINEIFSVTVGTTAPDADTSENAIFSRLFGISKV